jgi:hypothetical protein
MQGSRAEVGCAVGAGVWGLVLLAGAVLQPYGDSRCGSFICLHPGLTASQMPYVVAVVVPFALMVIGGVGDGLRVLRTAVLRVLLFVGTALLIIEAVVSFTSLGIVLLPGGVLGVLASAFALEARRVSARERV